MRRGLDTARRTHDASVGGFAGVAHLSECPPRRLAATVSAAPPTPTQVEGSAGHFLIPEARRFHVRPLAACSDTSNGIGSATCRRYSISKCVALSLSRSTLVLLRRTLDPPFA